jgi:hypothetical protein
VPWGSIDWKGVARIWRASGRTLATISVYTYWARRYMEACRSRRTELADSLKEAPVKRFYAAQVRSGNTTPPAAVRALWCALVMMGERVSAWRTPPEQAPFLPLVRDFVGYRLSHRGIARKSARFDAAVVSAFLRLLRRRRRTVAQLRLCDVDAFVEELGRTWAPRSVAAACSTLRALLAFLFATGRCKVDLAAQIISPPLRRLDRPRELYRGRTSSDFSARLMSAGALGRGTSRSS